MIIVAGHLTTDPAQQEAAHAAIAANVAATRAEAGCLDYRFSPDLDTPGRFNVIERWEGDDAMNAHLASPHLAEFLTALGPLITGDVEVIRYDVASSSKLF